MQLRAELQAQVNYIIRILNSSIFYKICETIRRYILDGRLVNDLFEHVQLAEDEGTMLLEKLLKGDWVVKTTV